MKFQRAITIVFSTTIAAFAIASVLLWYIDGHIPVALGQIEPADQQSPDPFVPSQNAFNYQGTLRNADGTLASDGTYSMVFSIYNTLIGESAGSLLHRETISNINVRDGQFGVVLGDNAAEPIKPDVFDIRDGQPRYLGVRVEQDANEMQPRQRIYPVPWATTLVPNATLNGLRGEVAIADRVKLNLPDGDGIYVEAPPQSGIVVHDSGGNGMDIEYADGMGLKVTNSGNDGIWVGFSLGTGINVFRALHHGIHVAGAERFGINVLYDDDGYGGVHVGSQQIPEWILPFFYKGDGIFVQSTIADGLQVIGTGSHGINVFATGGDGIHVSSTEGYAGYFDGEVFMTGPVSKPIGSFIIDHPLDPENAYLRHSFVESPDMMNIYNGTIELDSNGEAWVRLPDWFETLNQDFRYQLTPIGSPGPNLHIAQTIQNNRFKISGGSAGMDVSWQVTGIRHDPYAEAHPIIVEEEKPEEQRGTYLHPVEYGQPESMGTSYAKREAELSAQRPMFIPSE